MKNCPQHNLLKSVFLHLYPGVIILVLYLAFVPITNSINYPPLLALMASAVIVLLGLELGHLLRLGYKHNGKLSLEGIILYKKKMALLPFIGVTLGSIIFAFLVFGFSQPLGLIILKKFFAWLPDWYLYTDLEAFKDYPKKVIIITFAIRIALDGLFFPVVEELYFRGYLQPRLSRFGHWSPLISHVLFMLYHLWQPWNYPTIFLAILPLAYAVYWKQDYRLGIAIHSSLNILGSILTILAVLSL